MKILCVLGQYNYGNPARGEGYQHANFLPALRRLGHEVVLFDPFYREAYRDGADLNRQFLEKVQSEQPGIIFSVLLGYEIWLETLYLVRECCDAILINWATDDSWRYEQFSRFIAPPFHLYATTYPDALAKSKRDGYTNFVLTQWAANAETLAEPLPTADCHYPVSFVGSVFGNRRQQVAALAERGIPVECFGHGWDNGTVSSKDMRRIIRESVISLNFGDSGLVMHGATLGRSRQIKARNFEVPGCGGFVITERAQLLENFYVPDREVVMFDGLDELADKIKYYLAHPDERDAIALAGYRRTREQHTYDARFRMLLAMADQLKLDRAPFLPPCRGKARMGVEQWDSQDSTPSPALPLERGCGRFSGPTTTAYSSRVQGGGSRDYTPAHCEINFARFDAIEKKYNPGPLLILLKWVLLLPCMAIWGRQRGPRAARRLLFEISWRVAGEKTYTVTGWPGRLFFRES